MREYKNLLERVRRVVESSAAIVRENNGRPRTVRHKGSIDLVTETDVAVEEFLKRELYALEPGATFLAEESSADAALGEATWVIDPLDGTTNFAHGIPFVATSVALCRQGEPVLGVVSLPLLGEVFTAAHGLGAFCNGESIRVSSCSELQQSLIATGFPYDTETYRERILKQLSNMLRMTQGVRRPGAAALDLTYVACGRYDAFYEFALKPWDTAAGILLVQEAGGRVTRMDGETGYTLGARDILVSNGLLHAAVAEQLA